MARLDRFFQPDGWQEDTFVSKTGRHIRYGHATPPSGDNKGAVVITTGYADFIEAYNETIHEYLNRGYEVWIMDWAGHGGSGKKKPGDTLKGQTIEDHIEDLRRFRQEIAEPIRNKPVFLSTHSMGGQVALRYLHDHPDDFDFAVLATPLTDTVIQGGFKSFLNAFFQAAVACGLGDDVLEGGRRRQTKNLTAERAALERANPVRMGLHKTFMLLDDSLKAEDPTLGYVASIYASTTLCAQESFLKGIATPVLLGIGTADDVVDNDNIRRAARLMQNARTAEIDGGLHALWIDRDEQRRNWWAAIDSFIASQTQPPPGGTLPPPRTKGP